MRKSSSTNREIMQGIESVPVGIEFVGAVWGIYVNPLNASEILRRSLRHSDKSQMWFRGVLEKVVGQV